MDKSDRVRPENQQKPTADDLRRATCQQLAQQLIARYGWQLVAVDTLVEQTLAALPMAWTAASVQKTMMDCYAGVLYNACRQSDHQKQREAGYRELYRLLMGSARRTRPDQATDQLEEAAQRALVLIFEQIANCRQPATFLAFALYKLRQAFTEADRLAAKTLVPLDETVEQGELAQRATDLWHADEAQRERQDYVQAALATLGDERVKQVIVLKFLEGWSDQEIAQQLAITDNHVRVLRNRGVAHLRKQQL